MFSQPYVGRAHGVMPVLVDEDGGQFNYFLLGHLNHVKPTATERVPNAQSFAAAWAAFVGVVERW